MTSRIISGENISLREVTVDDALFIFELRHSDHLNTFINKTSQNIADQVTYIRKYLCKNDEWYFIIEDNVSREKLGTIRIYDVIDNIDFCWGSWLIKSDAPIFTALESALLLYEFAFYQLGFKKAHFDVRKGNIKVQRFHQFCGAHKTGETKEDILFSYYKEDYNKIRRLLKLK